MTEHVPYDFGVFYRVKVVVGSGGKGAEAKFNFKRKKEMETFLKHVRKMPNVRTFQLGKHTAVSARNAVTAVMDLVAASEKRAIVSDDHPE
ncbi:MULTISPECIES: hypothetical protein [Asticcacaulis]|uniref:hypothetical protein n=1 Tax=Asticcacaulis TaxID=76890 RepID=UPI001AE4010C|nr:MULTISPECIES: hypothetical protein [Asticcacaulis]MBP2158562.1 hypothetical protein [Asticcacaulis solisilvae]MDR6799608.1 hypothetical protein [Asticcacaulis sp. BE141]